MIVLQPGVRIMDLTTNLMGNIPDMHTVEQLQGWQGPEQDREATSDNELAAVAGALNRVSAHRQVPSSYGWHCAPWLPPHTGLSEWQTPTHLGCQSLQTPHTLGASCNSSAPHSLPSDRSCRAALVPQWSESVRSAFV